MPHTERKLYKLIIKYYIKTKQKKKKILNDAVMKKINK